MVKPTEEFDYYRATTYWNDFDYVVGRLGEKITGVKHGNWRKHVQERFGRARRALFVHCGNGWVERDFFRDGIIDSAFGTDVSESLLAEARNGAAAIGLPAEYVLADTNVFDFSKLQSDWVVNHAAFHHIAFLDRAVRSLAKMLGPDGLLVSYDYTGPHRNQYPREVWSAMVDLNASLPEAFRSELSYPHLPTMLATDPTEAVHSELILEVVERYFDIVEIAPLGGAIAYQLLFQNHGLHAAQSTPEGAAALQRIMDADDAWTRDAPNRSFFNFFVAKPRPRALDNLAQLNKWTLEENLREARAAANGGLYIPQSTLERITNRVSRLRDSLRNMGK